MQAVEAEGSTVEEAVEATLRQLNVSRDRVDIEVLSRATKGFLGIGVKRARVRATLRAPRRDTAAASRPRVLPTSAPARREEHAGEPTRVPPSREASDKACGVLKETLRLMGLEVPLSLETRDNEVIINLTDTVDGILIGRKGQTLDALEYILNRIITNNEDHEGHFVLDAEGYRERRRQNLEGLALRLGERAKRRRKVVTLSPLNPRDRRVVHLALQGDPLIETRSVGRGFFRRLSIVPEEGTRRERPRPD